MKGDFSNWRDESSHNFVGVLQQQGRVLLDGDWNAQTRIGLAWQDQAAQDTLGAAVAAVPGDAPDGFKIIGASMEMPGVGHAELTVNAGRVWAGGWLAQLPGAEPAERAATYLDTPLSDLSADFATPLRDAVILELWREEVSGFQLPDLLMEPALGGPDTTERMRTAMAFRLLRLGQDDNCESILARLQDDFSAKGRLTVTLQDADPGADKDDCPLAAGGGYTGFEHNLYRLEIARQEKSAAPMFKWSQFNGGLVGRADFDSAGRKALITANAPAIQAAGAPSFYLEAIAYDNSLGHWQVVYAAKADLNADDTLALPEPGSSDTWLGDAIPSGPMFFRLWGGLLPVADFAPAAKPWQDGILLQFDAPAAHGQNYQPGDYWTFPVRAGLAPGDAPALPTQQPPEGVHYRRVPLAIVTWKQAATEISDCRRVFQPLTRLSTCCSYRVGDGVRSHGDFDSIQEAVDRLPENGGEICVLPGLYREDVRIENRRNIVIKGCGPRTRLQATGASAPENEQDGAAPAVLVRESQNIRIESLAVEAHADGPGIVLLGPSEIDDVGADQFLRHVCLRELDILGQGRSAIAVHVGYSVAVSDCRVEMADVANAHPAIYFAGEDGVIERNTLRVPKASAEAATAQHSRGGIQVGGGSERVRIIGNLIEGGTGDGITLGSVDQLHTDGTIWIFHRPWWLFFLPGRGGCAPLPTFIQGGVQIDFTTAVAGAPLSDILIQGNRIRDMGRNGIGVDAFFDLSGYDEMISVKGLAIVGNDIRRCLNRPVDDNAEYMREGTGYGGYGGVVLADAEDLTVLDNIIEDNGRDHLQPVCGLFLLHGDGVEISRNRIVNNGPFPQNQRRQLLAATHMNRSAQGAKPGWRGGIVVVYAIAPYAESLVASLDIAVPFPVGRPAVKIHDNIVSAPLGQALSMGALGPVSVVGNQFTSLGVVENPKAPSFWAATVGILNLGLSNELWFQLLAFAAVRRGQVKPPSEAESVDDAKLGQYLANGNVLFANNQCQLNLLEAGLSFAATSVAVFSLDDVGFLGNQCDCDLFDDFVLAQAVVFGASVRVLGNRFKEPLFNALWSAMSFGWLNTTSDNQSTHCLLARGVQSAGGSNLVLIDPSREMCARYASVQGNWSYTITKQA